MSAAIEVPDDPALPGLRAIRSMGPAAALQGLDLDEPIAVRLCGYTPGSRATLEVRAGGRHVAVKVYAKDPSAEASLYQTLEAHGLAGDSGVRVPRLLAWDRQLRLMVTSWLPGIPAFQLIKNGNGRRAGELAGVFLRRIAKLRVRLGRTIDPTRLLYDVGRRVGALAVRDAALGTAAVKVARALVDVVPEGGRPHLVHGRLYERHILDLGDGPGVIDWERFGQGPLELDAGLFLATLSRLAVRNEALAGQVANAEEAFLAGVKRLVDPHSLAWHRAAALLRLALKSMTPAYDARLKALGVEDRAAVAALHARALLDYAANNVASFVPPDRRGSGSGTGGIVPMGAGRESIPPGGFR